MLWPIRHRQGTQHGAARRGAAQVLGGRDVIGTAQTGSGKTAAFALPILQQLAEDPYGVFALTLTPTRCACRLRRRPPALQPSLCAVLAAALAVRTGLGPGAQRTRSWRR